MRFEDFCITELGCFKSTVDTGKMHPFILIRYVLIASGALTIASFAISFKVYTLSGLFKDIYKITAPWPVLNIKAEFLQTQSRL